MSIYAWHFVSDRLRDGRPVPKNGVWLEHAGSVEMCASGLHASRDPFDALQFAPGRWLCRVECDGDIAEHHDKLVCRRRRIVERADAHDAMRYFARMQALSVVHLWTPPDFALKYLLTGDDAARAAVWDAAWAAGGDAARAAAGDAARCAVWDAARAATWDAVRAAAEAAARAAARAATSATTMGAAWQAAWADREDAAWAAARSDFAEMVAEAFLLPVSEVVDRRTA